jgi:hypothetical protein
MDEFYGQRVINTWIASSSVSPHGVNVSMEVISPGAINRFSGVDLTP